MRAWLGSGLVGLLCGFAPLAHALTLTVQQEIPLNGAPSNAEGIAVIPTGPNAGIYIPHRDSGLVTVLNATSGAFVYNFNSGLSGNLRSIDVLPNGNLLIGQHTTNVVREIVIPANLGGTPTASFGTISFTVPPHPDDNQVFDEFESLTPFRRPSDGQLFILLGEEGRNLPFGSGNEVAGEVYLAAIDSSGGIADFDKLFSVPLPDGTDDISGLDILDIEFDALGNLDLAASRIIMSDDSSGGASSAFVLDLTGMIIESLEDPATGNPTTFSSLFGQAWNDAEGVDYDPTTRTYTIFYSTGGGGTAEIVRFVADFETPIPEPAAVVLLGLALGGLSALRRART